MILTADTENYEEVKETAKSFLRVVTSNDFYYGLFLVAVMVILVYIIDFIFRPLKKRNSLLASFLRNCCKVFVIATLGLRILALIPGMKDFTSQIFLSSSLIVVVLGFVFFVLVLFAALTSAISLTETCVSILADAFGWSRGKSM